MIVKLRSLTASIPVDIIIIIIIWGVDSQI